MKDVFTRDCLAGKRVLISGALGALGKVSVEQLSRNGAEVILLAGDEGGSTNYSGTWADSETSYGGQPPQLLINGGAPASANAAASGSAATWPLPRRRVSNSIGRRSVDEQWPTENLGTCPRSALGAN